MADNSFSSDDGSAPITMSIDTSEAEFFQTPVGSQRSPAELKLWLKNNQDSTLTPATCLSSTSSNSSFSSSSPYVGNSSVKVLMIEDDDTTQPLDTSMNSSIGSLPQHRPPQKHLSQTQAMWVPLPSPSRPRLDPRYAARLAPTTTVVQSSYPPPSPRVNISSRRSSMASSTTSSLASESGGGDLMPPPAVTRNAGIFRPTPIIAPLFCDKDVSQALNSTRSSVGTPNLSGSPSPLSSTTSGQQQWFSSSARFSDVTSASLSTTATSTTIMGAACTPRHTKRTTADIGVSDRFIPNRATSNFNFNLWEGVSCRRTINNSNATNTSNYNGRDGEDRSNSNNMSNGEGASSSGGVAADSVGSGIPSSLNTVSGSSRGLLTTLLRSELLGENENPVSLSASSYGGGGYDGPHNRSNGNASPLQEGGNYLRFRSPRQAYLDNLFEDALGPTAIVNSFSLTPVGSAASQRLMAAPPKRKRRISKVPFKVLDAPALQDDFYLNLVDWSSQNVLAVGLGSCVYLWSACTSKVTKLCDLAQSEDIVTSVSWAQRGTHLSVGTNRGEVQLWDTIKCKKVRSMGGHTARVGTLAWTGPILASGSRDRLICLRDVRVQAPYTDKLTNHKQEVCGLKWSFEEPSFLASGGNDNNLHVIDSRHPSEPLHKFVEHTAAVKAIAWSPHQHGLLASGGGTADRCIRFWNTLSGSSLNKIDTGSQVCNLAWSQNCNEMVSTHGYSLNQIVVWRYPSMSKVTTLTGHTYRVLYLAMSPDGSTIVTGAGDETLRFWQIFPGPRSDGKDSAGGILFPNTLGSQIR